MILIITKLVKPLYLKISNSFLFINDIKKICVDIKNIKGSISKIIEGVFKNDKKTKYKKFKSIFLKKSICSNIFVTRIIPKKIKKILRNEVVNKVIKNFI